MLRLKSCYCGLVISPIRYPYVRLEVLAEDDRSGHRADYIGVRELEQLDEVIASFQCRMLEEDLAAVLPERNMFASSLGASTTPCSAR